MSQKLPFNNVPSIFVVPQNAPRTFHQLTESPPALWELYLWLATNGAPANATSINVVVTAVGTFGTEIVAEQFIPGNAVGQIFKMCSAFPVRGPLSLQIDGTAQDPKQPMVAYGYISRGTAPVKSEKRFFDPGSNIGDQQSSFEGGKIIPITAAVSPQSIHQTDEDFIDEITLDATTLVDGAVSGVRFDVSGGGVASEGPVGLVFPTPADGQPIRVFDGIPFRDAGLLEAFSTAGTTTFYNGHFTRN